MKPGEADSFGTLKSLQARALGALRRRGRQGLARGQLSRAEVSEQARRPAEPRSGPGRVRRERLRQGIQVVTQRELHATPHHEFLRLPGSKLPRSALQGAWPCGERQMDPGQGAPTSHRLLGSPQLTLQPMGAGHTPKSWGQRREEKQAPVKSTHTQGGPGSGDPGRCYPALGPQGPLFRAFIWLDPQTASALGPPAEAMGGFSSLWTHKRPPCCEQQPSRQPRREQARRTTQGTRALPPPRSLQPPRCQRARRKL